MKLASRMLLIGFAQLALLAATAIIIVVVTLPDGDVRPEDHVDRAQLEPLATTPKQLHDALLALRDKQVSVSIYNSDGQLVDSNVDPPLAPPPRRPRGPMGLRPDHGPDRGPPWEGPPPRQFRDFQLAMIMPFHINGDRGVLVARGRRAEPPGWTGPILILVFGVLILVVGPVLTARWLVRPIEKLSQTARAFGNGDLVARSGLRRADEIGDLGRRMDEMADRIEGLIRAEKELFANVAHELRTPLARIGVALDLAAAGDSVAARSSLAEIAMDLTELETILDDIMSTMRFEIAQGNVNGGQVPLRKEIVSPLSVVEAAVERQHSRHPDRGVAVNVDDGVPPLEADPMLLRRVLDNLLENSHKYTPDPKAVTHVRVRGTEHEVKLEVTDRGLGISPDDLPRVFTAFFRSDRSRSRETGGVGLGLALAKRIVEAHGGHITVTSQLSEGTTMHITLPAALPNIS